jgi:predicted dinucleotide-utilizing enzyme
MNKYVLSIALLVASTGAFAQNRLVKKAQGLIKNNQRC